jgi:hemerythrin HHE cation binding domain-containing protein
VPDVTRLILDDHETLRRRFADLDDAQASGDLAAVRAAWEPLGDLLDLHAEAEEQVFYPKLLEYGLRPRAEDETEDAIDDHNKIRQGVRDAAEREPGSDGWWEAVGRARTENSEHIAEEEREALSDFRLTVPLAERYELGLAWIRFRARHGGESDIEGVDKDAEEYIAEHEDGSSGARSSDEATPR